MIIGWVIPLGGHFVAISSTKDFFLLAEGDRRHLWVAHSDLEGELGMSLVNPEVSTAPSVGDCTAGTSSGIFMSLGQYCGFR